MQKLNRAIGMAAGIALAAVVFHAPAQGRDFSKVQIKTVKLTDSIHVLFGAGGNIGVSVGDDGVFLIDDQYAPLEREDPGRGPEIERQADPLHHQHPLAPRPHRRQREYREGRRGHRRP